MKFPQQYHHSELDAAPPALFGVGAVVDHLCQGGELGHSCEIYLREVRRPAMNFGCCIRGEDDLTLIDDEGGSIVTREYSVDDTETTLDEDPSRQMKMGSLFTVAAQFVCWGFEPIITATVMTNGSPSFVIDRCCSRDDDDDDGSLNDLAKAMHGIIGRKDSVRFAVSDGRVDRGGRSNCIASGALLAHVRNTSANTNSTWPSSKYSQELGRPHLATSLKRSLTSRSQTGPRRRGWMLSIDSRPLTALVGCSRSLTALVRIPAKPTRPRSSSLRTDPVGNIASARNTSSTNDDRKFPAAAAVSDPYSYPSLTRRYHSRGSCASF